jgi:hypothetical protein
LAEREPAGSDLPIAARAAAGPEATHVTPSRAVVGAVLLDIPGYDLMPEIARGGMGVVYAARDRALDRQVAVKVMLPGMDAAAFNREARITGHLPHPGIPPVHALGTVADGRPFLVMKLIRGDTLDTVLKARTDLTADLGRLLAAFEQMCQAVGYAHAQGIIHRDLKPSNVMVGAFGEVQVMDWGLAKELGGAAPEGGPLSPVGVPIGGDTATVAGQVKGTPSYMAPEQARCEPVDARADVFALGGILVVILTGRPPFVGTSVLDTIIRAAQADLGKTFSRLKACGADAELRAICKRCLAARADGRYSDAAELAAAVAGYRAAVEERLRRAERERAADEARAAEEANTRREAEAKATERRKRQRTQRVLAAAVLLLAVAGGFGVVVAALWRTSEANRAEAETQRDTADHAKDDALREKRIADGAKDEALRQKLNTDGAKAEALKAKDDALQQKRIADGAKDEALKAQGVAEKAQSAEAEARQKLAVFEYGGTMRVAHQEWRDNNLVAMRALLDGTDPKLRNWEWQYLNRLCDPSLLTLKGDTGWWYAASFSADGTRIVTASRDNTAKVWDARTGAETLTLKGHTKWVDAASFSADGTRIVTGSSDGTAKVWDAKTGAETLTLKGHPEGVYAVSFSADGTRIITGSSDGTAMVWDARPFRDSRPPDREIAPPPREKK